MAPGLLSRIPSSWAKRVGFPTGAFSPGKAKVAENFFALSSVQIANYLLPLVTVPYLLRVIGIEKYGLIAFAQSLTQYFVTLTDYGFNLSATRDVSINRGDRKKLAQIFTSVIAAKVGLMAVSFFAFCALVFTVPRLHADRLLYLFTFGQVVGNVLLPFWFFQGIEKMKYITILNFVDRLFFTLSLFIFIRKGQDYLYVPLITSLGTVVAGVLGISIATKGIKVTADSVSCQAIADQLRKGWHVFISAVAVTSYTTSRIFVVGLFTNPAITGAYALAEKLVNIIRTFPLVSLSQAAYPRLASMYAQMPGESYRAMRKLRNLTTAAFLVVLPCFLLLGSVIVRVVAGTWNGEAALVFRILLVSVLFVGANTFPIQFLLVAGKEKVYSRINLLTSVIGLGAVLAGVYFFSYLGPPSALAGIELLALILTVRGLREVKSQLPENAS
jgi:PST family polysaccharide transporter